MPLLPKVPIMPTFDSPIAELLSSKLIPSVLTALLNAPLPGLRPGPRHAELAQLIDNAQTLTAADVQLSANARLALESALWLVADELDRSHAISQNLATPEGSFWHGVMHRREADFSNAKYWFHKAREQSFYKPLAAAIAADPLAAEIQSGPTWDPSEFVDQCQQAIRGGGQLQQQCQRAQCLEWQFAVAALF